MTEVVYKDMLTTRSELRWFPFVEDAAMSIV